MEALAHLAQRGDREARSLTDVKLEDDFTLRDNVGIFLFRRQATTEVPYFFCGWNFREGCKLYTLDFQFLLACWECLDIVKLVTDSQSDFG